MWKQFCVLNLLLYFLLLCKNEFYPFFLPFLSLTRCWINCSSFLSFFLFSLTFSTVDHRHSILTRLICSCGQMARTKFEVKEGKKKRKSKKKRTAKSVAGFTLRTLIGRNCWPCEGIEPFALCVLTTLGFFRASHQNNNVINQCVRSVFEVGYVKLFLALSRVRIELFSISLILPVTFFLFFSFLSFDFYFHSSATN